MPEPSGSFPFQPLSACSKSHEYSNCEAAGSCLGGSAGEDGSGTGDANTSVSTSAGSSSGGSDNLGGAAGEGGDNSSSNTGSGGNDTAGSSSSGGGAGMSGDSSAGGTGGTAECVAASDCNDGSFCNGEERCSDGQCVSGEAPCKNPDPEFCAVSCDEQTDTCRVTLDGQKATGEQCKDECASGDNDCAANAECINDEIGYRCQCPEGWFGDGSKCEAGVRALSASDTAFCAVKYDGTIWCWGGLVLGAGNGGPVAIPTPIPVLVSSDRDWDAISLGQWALRNPQWSLVLLGGQPMGKARLAAK